MKRSILILFALIFLSVINLYPQQRVKTTEDTVQTFNKKIKIAIWGDSRENLDNACENIAGILLEKITDWNIQLHTGDFTHDGSNGAWKRSLSFKGMDQLFTNNKMLLVTSNHEFISPSGRENWDIYTDGILPVNSLDSTTHFYAYHIGNVHIICCDPYLTDSDKMQLWLDNYLNNVKPGEWIIAAWHDPSYNYISYKESFLNKSMPWLKSLYAHHCKFVFNGHAHIYLRTKPLDPAGTIDKKNGIVHIINGTGGASWKSPQPYVEKTAFTPDEKSFPCITFLTIEGNSGVIQTLDARPGNNLKIIDEYKVEN
jgi:large repetitive protein